MPEIAPVTVTLRTTPEERAELDAFVARFGMSISHIALRAMQRSLVALRRGDFSVLEPVELESQTPDAAA